MDLMRRPKRKVLNYRNRLKLAAGGFVEGQSLQRLNWGAEFSIVQEDYQSLFDSSGATGYRRVLTATAQADIEEYLKNHRREEWETATEPPYMAPSPNPKDYSLWCSLCNDFPQTLLLCSRCRVGACVTSADSDKGCLAWAPCILEDGFVFKCPFCAKRLKVECQLRPIDEALRKDMLYFRYDPAVLILSLKWHGTVTPFADQLETHLLQRYVGHEGLIARMDLSLETAFTAQVQKAERLAEEEQSLRTKNGKNGGKARAHLEELMGDLRRALTFLGTHETAKIVVVIDTHCADNGFPMYAGNDSMSYQACSLFEILSQCIPKQIWQFLDASDGSPDHSHRSIILNLSCGASITKDPARHALMEGHCADAVVSFATRTVMVGLISARLLEFTALWTQTPSGYDFLVAKTLGPEWVGTYLPVISREDGHFLYTRQQQIEPSAKLLECPLKCGDRLKVLEIRKEKARIQCPRCMSRCSVEIMAKDTKTILGRREIVKVEYPRQRYMATWESKEDREARMSAGRPPALTSRSTSLPIRTPTSLPSIAIAAPPAAVLSPESLRIPSTPVPSTSAMLDVRPQELTHSRSTPNLGPFTPFYQYSTVRQPKRPSPRGEEGANKKMR